MAHKPYIRVYDNNGYYGAHYSELNRLIKWWANSSDPFLLEVQGCHGNVLYLKRDKVIALEAWTEEAVEESVQCSKEQDLTS